MGLSLKEIGKAVAKVGPKVLDAGAVLGVPGMAQLDAVVDAIRGSSANDEEKSAALLQLDMLKKTPVVIHPDVVEVQGEGGARALLDSTRIKMTLINIGVIVAVNIMANYGILTQGVADYVGMLSTGSIGMQVAMETIRPSGQARRD